METLPKGPWVADALTVCQSRKWLRNDRFGFGVIGGGPGFFYAGVSLAPAGAALLAERRLRPPVAASTDSSQESSVPATTVPADSFTPAERRALGLHDWALDQQPELDTDRAVYDFLGRRAERPMGLPPTFETFRRYLSGARRKSGTNKHSPRPGRQLRGSTVRQNEV